MGNINESMTLPCGLVLPNRLVKAAMTEGVANPDNSANIRHVTLYKRWAKGGVGCQITGNVLVDRRYLESAGNVVIEGTPSNEAMAGLANMADAAKSEGGAVIMQISHAGRQTPKVVNDRPIAPSAVALNMPGRSLYPFSPPRAMTEEEVEDVILRFVNAAQVAEKAGYDGVQIHGAHGYLISQFLSPLSNQREDQWGGPLENRARLLLEIIRKTREAVSPRFAVGVKLNSTDFQKGGFSQEDCLAVIDWLNAEAVDFVEVSGGNYEQPQMMGMEGLDAPFEERPLRKTTAEREAYFVEYAKAVRARANMPIMATGGFRARETMDRALAEGKADLIGLARPLCSQPELPKDLLSGEEEEAVDYASALTLGKARWLGPNSPISIIKTINGWGAQGWHVTQLHRMSNGLDPDLKMGVMKALNAMQGAQKSAAKAYHADMASG